MPIKLSDAALELARGLRALGENPKTRLVLRGLEAALPDAAREVRAALEDPSAALGALAATVTKPARDELAEADEALARGFARAFGRGIAKGAKKSR